jgi:hypothetical protein
VLTIWVCNFWQKEFGAKAAHKMLVKLTRECCYAECCYAGCRGALESIQERNFLASKKLQISDQVYKGFLARNLTPDACTIKLFT